MKTTKKEFNYFRGKVYEFANVFGLKNWDIYVQHSPCDESGSIAECSWDSQNRCATVGFNTTYDKKIYDLSEYYLKRDSFHEVGHIFLAPIHDLMRMALIHEDVIIKKVHKIIATLENVIFEPD